VFIKRSAAGRLFADGLRPELFSSFLQRCRREALQLRSIKVGGFVLDLDTEQGLLGLLEDELAASPSNRRRENSKAHQQNRIQKNVRIAPSARIFGKVLFGQNVTVENDVILAGPACLGDNVKVGQAATVRAAVLGTGVSVPRNSVLENCILLAHPQQKQESERGITSLKPSARYLVYRAGASRNGFRTWPRVSYARCFKRVADITVALVVLSLFAPFLPLLALVIKLTSHGPVFFKDLRQGLHGRPFSCLKFRTMLVGADKMQAKLRTLNEADGPQFKMDGDPRTSVVGDFLRDTYIDEIPQFLNVLLGQMSVVGPRPSPESENTLCPPWRDARLSVRPGITGLWQVCRTRRPGKDFQEWIHYDTKYVTDLSFKMDLWIAWRTANKMLLSFARRF
jgi:lipopolysaccharide/colanic/teichoic acid biosynthesis glycosyltransferase